MPYLAKQRLTGDSNVVMKHVRKPKFVDNALHLGEITHQGATKQKVTIRQRNSTNYALTPETEYELTEIEGGMRVMQPQVDGHEKKTTSVYMGSLLDGTAASNIPQLIFAKDDTSLRLAPSSVLTSTEGSVLTLRNLQGGTAADLGFQSTRGYLGQTVDVGLRTTDMALRLGRVIENSLTSVNIALPRTPSNTASDRRKHSTEFVATDFYDVNLMEALRFLGRHDNHVVYFDEYGNMLYIPATFGGAGRVLDANTRFGSSTKNPIENVPNRIAVQGVPVALNQSAYALVNDGERQSGRTGDIQAAPEVIEDITVNSSREARRVALNILKANNLEAGSRSSNGHPEAWDLRPGKIIEYEGVRRIITEASHSLSSGQSNFVFLMVDTGIEGVLQGIKDGISISTKAKAEIEQINELNMSLFADLKINAIPIIQVNQHGASGTGFVIGKAMARGTIGKTSSQETVGGSKSTPVVFRGDL